MVARFKKTVAFGFSKVWAHFGAIFTLTFSFAALFAVSCVLWSVAVFAWARALIEDLRALVDAVLDMTGDPASSLAAARTFVLEAFKAGQEVYLFLLAVIVIVGYFIVQIWTYFLIKLQLHVYHKDKGIGELSVKGKASHFWRFIWAKILYDLAVVTLLIVGGLVGYYIIVWPWAMVESSILRFLLLLAGFTWIAGVVCLFVLARVRLRFFPYIILDSNMGVIESLSASGRITLGHSWYIFSYALFYAFLYTFMHWLFAYFFFTPAAIGSDVYAYHALKDQKKKK